MKLVQACLTARRHRESSFHHWEGAVRFVLPCLSARKHPVSQRIRSPRKSDPGRIRHASDFDPTSADSNRGINGAIGFLLSTSHSKLWCIRAELTQILGVYK